MTDVSIPFIPIASTPEMRARLRELATPPRDDFDRAVNIVVDDFNRLYRVYEELRRSAIG